MTETTPAIEDTTILSTPTGMEDSNILFSVYSWIIVLVFQILVHYWFSGRLRHITDGNTDAVTLSEPVVDPSSSSFLPLNDHEESKKNYNNNNSDDNDDMTTTTAAAADDRSHASARSPRGEVLQSLSSTTQPGGGGDSNCSFSSFDGDEPEIFFELLSQTGSEMTRKYSHHSIVQEQLEVAC